MEQSELNGPAGIKDAPWTILIVEDDLGLSDLIHKELTDQGLGCACTVNGKEALEWLGHNHADLLLLDYSLPDMPGSRLIEKLSRRPSAIPFIVITGHGDEHIAVDMMKAGAQDYLVKDTGLLERLPTIVTRALKDIEHTNRIDTMEAALKESQEQYRRIIDAITDYIFTVEVRDGKAVRTLHRPTCEAVTGYRVEEFENDPYLWLNMVVEEDRALVDEHARHILDGGNPGPIEHRIRRKDGRICWVSNTPVINRDASGTIDSYDGVISDITARKEVEEEHKRLQARMVQVQKMEAIGTLAGGIAHDFNNILSTVLGYTELAKMKLEQGKSITNELEEVLKAGIRARDLIKQIITFSRQADIKRTPLEIVPLIKETIKFLKASLPATIEIRQDLRVSHSLIMADPTQIHQVLMNLCTNATHAIGSKGGQLDIRVSELDLDAENCRSYKGLETGRYLRLSVSDNGCGIPREIIDRIFDPFFTTKERGEGTGMGLSVVHGIVTSMHGAVSVYSEPGQGTTFHILLPAFEGQSTAVELSPAAPKQGHGRILFVDDEDGVLASGRGILEQLGYEVDAINSPLAALEIFAERPQGYDLILTDMTMPKMTGLEMAAKIREINPAIPIILSTGFSLGLTDERVTKLGIRDLVLKPMVANELAEAVYHALLDARS